MTEEHEQATSVPGLVERAGDGPAANPPARVENRTMPPCTVIPELVYDDVTAAIDWLCDAFGLVERWRAGDHRAQLSLGRCTVAITEPRTSKVRPGVRDLVVRVPDAAAHCRHARARGATIIREPTDFPYGERQYTAEDPGGHHWTFSQSIADVAPEEWGGTSGPGMTAPAGSESIAVDSATPARSESIAADSATPAVSRAHNHATAISVMLIVPNAEAAIAWYKDALGAQELWNLGGVAGLHVAGAPFFLHEINPANPTETSPDRAGATSVRIELFVDDPDDIVARALAAGATQGSEVVDREMAWGTHRQGGFRDPFGHNWSVGDRAPLTG